MSSSPASTSDAVSQIFAGGYVALQCQLKGRAFATTLFARAHAARAEDDRFPAQRTLFALNVPPRADADGLRAAFGRLGDVESVELGRLGGDAAAADDAGPRTAHVVFARAAALKKALRAARPVQLALAEAPAAAAAAGGDGGEDREALQRSVDAFMRSFEADEGRRRRELEASHNRMDGDGFTLVTRQQKGTGRSTGGGATVGVASRGAAAAAAGAADGGADDGGGGGVRKKKKKAKELVDFYHFQQHERKRSQLLKLREQFEQDKSKIAKMREARAFKPY